MAARLLIVEDNADSLELMRYLLAAQGHAVSVAEDGASGIAIATAEVPDLILCDVQLPDIDGFEVARRLKGMAALSGKPLVAVTALAMVGDRDRVLANGFDGYLTKPIAPETFAREVEAFLHPGLRSQQSRNAPIPLAEPTGVSVSRSPRGRILVVDDLQDNLDLATSVFEYAGYRVDTASNVRDGLEMAHRVMPDLILSDVNMGESGFDFIRAAKADASLRDIPFVFISSTLTTPSAQECGLRLGAVRYLIRPIDAVELLAAIESSMRAR